MQLNRAVNNLTASGTFNGKVQGNYLGIYNCNNKTNFVKA